MNPAADTIFAVSSGPGRGAIAIIRLSGPKAGAALERLSGRGLPRPRFASLRALSEPTSGEALDQALVLWLPRPRSFTGEDMVELHVHGGRAVIAGVLAALGAMPGLRPAEPGEFARRAFDHGRLDLIEAEGIADLINAETAAQRRQALRQMEGALSALYEGWRGAIIEATALAEADIDFSDQDLPDWLGEAGRQRIGGLATSIEQHLDDARRGELVRDGFEIAIVGAPNAGKSSLLNALAKRPVAIVAETAGTTRDVVEIRLDLDGYPVVLADTAGLRESADAVEAEGVRRALARAERADLKIVVLDGTTLPNVPISIAKLIDERALVLVNKCDLTKDIARSTEITGHQRLPVSCRTGEGLGRLLDRLGEIAASHMPEQAAPALSQIRHRVALLEAASSLRRAARGEAPELVAEDLRLAARALGRVTGRVDVEDILDQIFRTFCIGK